MKTTTNKVSYEFFKRMRACEPALTWFEAEFGKEEVEFGEVYPKIKQPGWAAWLIKNCEFCQTAEMVEFYKSLNPSYEDVSWLIVNCKFCQTAEMVEFYKSLNPSYCETYNSLDELLKAKLFNNKQRS